MKRVFWLVVIVLALASQYASALQYITFEKVTVNGAPTGFTVTSIVATTTAGSTGHPQAQFGSCRATLAEMRYTIDGSLVTATRGTLIEPGEIVTLQGADVLQAFRAIITGLTTGALDCNYWLP